MDDVLNIANALILSNVTDVQLVDEMARRYNRNPASIRDALSAFMYAYDAMETAHEDEVVGNDEEDAGHGRQPF